MDFEAQHAAPQIAGLGRDVVFASCENKKTPKVPKLVWIRT